METSERSKTSYKKENVKMQL